jgi:mono/diheme cytochrome c family protein
MRSRIGKRRYRRLAAVLAAALVAGAASAQQARLFDEPEDLPEGEGRELTFYQCSACHGFNLVARQGMSRAMWDDTLTLMVERHGMYALEPAEREEVLSYLEQAYPPPETPGGWVNPFANR